MLRNFFMVFTLLLSVSIFAQKSAPKISIDNKVHNFGDIKENVFVAHDYLIKNTGTEALKITKVNASCGCTAAQPDKTELEPGDSTYLHVEFNSAKRSGIQNKHVYVFSNDPVNPQVRLSFTAVVLKKTEEEKLNEDNAYIRIDEHLIKLGDIKKGGTKTFEVPIKNIGKKDLVINGVRSTCSCITTELTSKRIAPGEEAVLKGEFNTENRQGEITRTITIISNDPYKSYFNVTIFANIVD